MAIVIPDRVRHCVAQRFDLDPDRLSPMNRGGAPDGAVYPCRRDGRELFLKIKPLSGDVSRERARLDFLDYLHRNGIRVPEPVTSVAGNQSEYLRDGDTGYLATLTVKAPGRHPRLPDDWTPALISTWGATMGRMHALASRYPAVPDLPTWRGEIDGFRASCRDAQLGAVWDEFAAAFARLPCGAAEFGPVHNDQHLGNLLLTDPDPGRGDAGPGLVVLDFDVCGMHWFVADLAIALVHPIWEMRRAGPAGIRPFVDTFLSGYTAHFPLPPRWATHLPMFMRYRMTLLVLAVARELGHPRPLPAWLTRIRTWVLSDEPLADLG